jgi:hypothetical protein
MGRWLRSRPTTARALASVLLPAVLFFVTTNFAHWMIDIHHAGSAYTANWHGLLACYARGVPFFRWMLEGDVAFSAILFGAWALATSYTTRCVLGGWRRQRLASAHVSARNSRC